MTAIQIRAKLILKGLTMADVGRMMESSRQSVRYAISKNNFRIGSKSFTIRKKIMEIIGQ